MLVRKLAKTVKIWCTKEKNTQGQWKYFLFLRVQFVCVCVCLAMSDYLQPHVLHPARLLCPWDFPGKNTGVGCHVFLQGIFPTQGLNPGLPHCRQILYPLSHQGSPRILEWVAYPFSRGSSQPRNWTSALQVDSLPAEIPGVCLAAQLCLTLCTTRDVVQIKNRDFETSAILTHHISSYFYDNIQC